MKAEAWCSPGSAVGCWELGGHREGVESAASTLTGGEGFRLRVYRT